MLQTTQDTRYSASANTVHPWRQSDQMDTPSNCDNCHILWLDNSGTVSYPNRRVALTSSPNAATTCSNNNLPKADEFSGAKLEKSTQCMIEPLSETECAPTSNRQLWKIFDKRRRHLRKSKRAAASAWMWRMVDIEISDICGSDCSVFNFIAWGRLLKKSFHWWKKRSRILGVCTRRMNVRTARCSAKVSNHDKMRSEDVPRSYLLTGLQSIVFG